MIPSWTPICGFGRWCFLAMLSPSTRTRSSASTSMTAPRRPLSRPVIRTTMSPLRIFFIYRILESQHFGCERNDLHELHIPQLARHRPEDTRADRLELVGQQDGRVGVEADQRPVGAAHAALGAHHDGVIHFAFLDFAARDGVLDADLDDIAGGGIAPLGAAQHLYAHAALGAPVIGYIQYGSHLNHVNPLFGSRTLYDAHQHPRFTARHRPARLDRHGIAFLALVALVMREQFRGAADVLPIHGMLDQTLDGDGDGLVHLVADDFAREQALSRNGSRAPRRSRARIKH